MASARDNAGIYRQLSKFQRDALAARAAARTATRSVRRQPVETARPAKRVPSRDFSSRIPLVHDDEFSLVATFFEAKRDDLWTTRAGRDLPRVHQMQWRDDFEKLTFDPNDLAAGQLVGDAVATADVRVELRKLAAHALGSLPSL
jgi:hypothetical protein